MKVALIGYGKMGKEIEKVVLEQNNESSIKNKAQIVLKISDENLHELTVENLKKADVAIEFTQPEAAVSNIYKCFDAGIPVVVGTTAWLSRLEEVKQQCAEKKGTLFFSPNYSVGVNIFWEVNKRLAQIMNKQPQYELSMEEIHHTEKKDAPSGTAVKTAEVILNELERKKGWKLSEDGRQKIEVKAESGISLRTSDSGLSASSPLLIVAKREPNVPGTHTVTYRSGVDFIEIKHEAISRRGFAEGAVLAARFVVGKKGVFEMKDLLAF